MYVLLDFDLVKPIFGKVIELMTFEQTVLVCVQEYYGHIFHAHYNSYELNTHGSLIAVNAHALADHRPLLARSSFVSKSLYITLPYIALCFHKK